jgi:hypothetical protein
MASKGKEKGNRGQRLARDLMEKWTGKKFASTASEGGIGWNKDPHKGDLCCKTEGHYFPFSVECKFYEKIDFSHLLVPGIKNVAILDFWAQCIDDAKRQKKIPMLMIRYNGLPKDFFFVILHKDFYHALDIWAKLTTRISLEFWDRDKKEKIIILSSREFFSTNYKSVKKIAKTHKRLMYEKS